MVLSEARSAILQSSKRLLKFRLCCQTRRQSRHVKREMQVTPETREDEEDWLIVFGGKNKDTNSNGAVRA